MALDPKGVAKIIRGIMKSPDERRQEAESNRVVQFKILKNRLRRHINQQREMAVRLTGLAKQAISINDETAFKKIGRQLIWTNNDVRRWERYILSLEMLEARHDQVKASTDLLMAVKSMSESLSDLAAPENLGKLQNELEQGLAKASNLEEQMEVMMGLMDSTLAGDMQVDAGDLSELERALAGDVARSEAAEFDPELEQMRQKIKAEMNKP
jgi:hypothetical protein